MKRHRFAAVGVLVTFAAISPPAANAVCPTASTACLGKWCVAPYEGLDADKRDFLIDFNNANPGWLGFNPCTDTNPVFHPGFPMDVSKSRSHAWAIWSVLNRPASHSRLEPGSRPPPPRWTTWPNESIVFPQPGNPKLLTFLPLGEFTDPATWASTLARTRAGRATAVPARVSPPSASHVGVTVKEVVFYNAQAAAAIENCCLNGKLAAALAATGGGESLDGFPADSVALKTLWVNVLPKACTTLPVWDGMSRSPKIPAQPSGLWPRQIQVCPPGKSGGLPLARFYWVNADALPDLTDAKGFWILVGMHVITHEVPNWVWATFWWHDYPDQGQFAADRPPQSTLPAPWNSYLMDVAYDMELPWQPSGLPKAIFNPYLEGGFIDGTHSNCISCHRRAIWPTPTDLFATLDSFGPVVTFNRLVVTGRPAVEASYMPESNCWIRTAFLWSIARLPTDTLPACKADAPTASGP
jgi:hypothetical protein